MGTVRELGIKFTEEGLDRLQRRAEEVSQSIGRSFEDAVARSREAVAKAGAGNLDKEVERQAKALRDTVNGAFRHLGVRSEAELDKLRKKAQSAFNAIKQSGIASAKDIEKAQAALARRLREIDQMARGRAQPARRGAAALGALSGEAAGQMQALSAQAGVLGRALGAIHPAGLAAAAGIGAVVLSLKKGVSTAESFERLGLRTEAILKATGYASGQTAASIRQMAEEIALSTLASVQGVEQAAQKLLTFRNVGEDIFRRTLEVSQDLAAVGFGSIESAAVQLGKALEDPEQGLSALTRVGVSFSKAQKDLIKQLVATNRAAEAQKILLENVERQVGGAGKAEAKGLAGAYDTLAQRVETFWRKLGESGPLQAATKAINGLASAVNRLNETLWPESHDQIERMNRLLENTVIIVSGLVAARFLGPLLAGLGAGAVAFTGGLTAANAALLLTQARAAVLTGTLTTLRAIMAVLGGPGGLAILAATGLYILATRQNRTSGQRRPQPPSAHRTVRTGPYTAPHVRLIH